MPDQMTHAELDTAVRSLASVGGLFELVAILVDRYNRPHCTTEGDG